MKKNSKKIINYLGVFILIATLLLASTTIAVGSKKFQNKLNENFFTTTSAGNSYEGILRVYIVEIESRWKMYSNVPYHFALYDTAFEEELDIKYLDTFENTILWDGDIEEDNVIVMAALYNPEGHKNYADPPNKRPFTAHYIDAAAAALPGETGYNTVNQDFTHTVLVEKGTATWCPSCPGMASKLKDIYQSNDYPFYYISMVVDKSNAASNRMNDFSLYWLPTVD